MTVEELNRIQQLINNLLAYGKEIEVKNEEWIDFTNFLNEIALKNTLYLEATPFVKIFGDRFLLNLLFDNFMRNSKAEGADKVQVYVRTGKSADMTAEILIEDNGNGFTTEVDINTLLNPFITFHSSGAGLGLYLAKQVATAHEGRLSLYRMEHGAGVSVTLPQRRLLLNEQT